MGLPLRDSHLHTYGEYLTWPDEPRYELIDGRAYTMAPAPSRRHQEIVGELFSQIHGQLRGHPCRVYIAPFDVRLPRGAPDWIIEVLSPGTASHDQLLKRDLYERQGVAEYWLVHPHDRLITVYRLHDGAYGKPHVQEFSGSLAPQVPADLQVDLDLLAAQLVD